jgi:hypothetical protein
MNRLELSARLIANNVDARFFSVDGTSKDECLTLENKSPDTWVVYYSERGLRTGERFFASESEACEYILATLLRDPTVKKSALG